MVLWGWTAPCKDDVSAFGSNLHSSVGRRVCSWSPRKQREKKNEDTAYLQLRGRICEWYLSVYDSGDGVSEHAVSPSPPSSLTHIHRSIGSRNGPRQMLCTSVKLTYLSVYDSGDGISEHTSFPTPPSSLTDVHRCIGSRNATRQTLPTSVKLTYLSVYDSRDGVSDHTSSPSPPSSLTYVHRDGISEHTTSPSPPSSLTHVHRCV